MRELHHDLLKCHTGVVDDFREFAAAIACQVSHGFKFE
jgi:hypothetical protein